jgi:hypothetical protein
MSRQRLQAIGTTGAPRGGAPLKGLVMAKKQFGRAGGAITTAEVTEVTEHTEGAASGAGEYVTADAGLPGMEQGTEGDTAPSPAGDGAEGAGEDAPRRMDVVDGVDPREIAIDDVENELNRLVAKVAELEAALAQERTENETLMAELSDTAVAAPRALETGPGGAEDPLGLCTRTQVPIYLKKPWGRNVGVEVGDCIGYVVTRDGVDLNLLIDAVRNQVAGEACPVKF